MAAATTTLSLSNPTSDILQFLTETPISCRFATTKKPWLPSATELRSDFLTQHSSIAALTSSQMLRGIKQVHGARVACALASENIPSLKDLPVFPYIDSDGMIQPPVEAGTPATVFAVYDNNMRVQYIGFSKDFRNSLRTLIGRRPELCHFYKFYNLPALDQKQLLAARQQWILELGTTPRGNSDVTQKNMWEKPVDSGSTSQSGKALAAAAKAKMLLQTLVDKGLKELMVYDSALLEQGKCDILPDKDILGGEQTTAVLGPAQDDTRRKHVVINAPTGHVVEYEIFYEGKYKTNGGWMYDIAVKKDDKETRHRVICGQFYPEAVNMHEDTFLETVMGFLLHKKVPRHTEGMRLGGQFPINYFAVGEVSQKYDDFKTWFSAQLPDDYWRFNNIHTYGILLDPPAPVGPEETVNTMGMQLL